MKKVLIFSVEYPPKCGGAGNVAFDTANKLIKLGYTVDILTNKKACVQRSCKFLSVRQLPIFFPLQYGYELLKVINNYNTIILNDLGAALTACIFLNKQYMKKTIVFLQGSEPEKVYISPQYGFRLIGFSNKYTRLLAQCRRIICVSEFMKEKIMSVVPEIDSHQFRVVHSGVDRTVFYPEQTDLKRIHNINKDTKIIFTASRIVKQKGYLEMYDIFKRLIEAGKNYVWIIAGDGIYKEELQEHIQIDGFCNRIIFVGNLRSDKLRQYYSVADVFVLLSKFKEAYGLVYLEALMCGTPVIGLNLGGTKEVIKTGKNGFLVENEQECLNVLKHEEYKRITSEMIRDSLPNYENEFMELVNALL